MSKKEMSEEEQFKEEGKQLKAAQAELVREEEKRRDKVIRQMKEGKVETLGTIVVGEGEIYIHIEGDKLIWVSGDEFLNELGRAMNFMGSPPEFDLIVSRIQEIQAKRIRHDAEKRIREAKAKKKG